MRRVEISWKNPEQTIGKIFLLAQDDKQYICVSDIGKILIYSKADFSIRFLDPSELDSSEEENAITKKDYMDLFDNLVEHKGKIQSLEQRVEKFGNPEFVKTEKLRLDNAHAKIHNLTTEVDTLKKRVESLENLNKSRSMLEKLKGEPERVVGNPDEPQPTFTRIQCNYAFTNWALHLPKDYDAKEIHVADFLSELDKIRGSDV
jgi:predicted transcriptional regulator